MTAPPPHGMPDPAPPSGPATSAPLGNDAAAYVAAVIAAALLATTVALLQDSFGSPRTIAVWALAAAIGQHFSFPSLTGRGHVSLSTATHLCMILVLPPGVFLPALGVSRLAMALVERKPWYRALFNSAQVVLAVLAGWIAWRAVAGPAPFAPTPGHMTVPLLGFAAAALAYYVTNVSAVSGVLAMTGGTSILAAWRANYGHRQELLGTLTLVLLAPLVALAWSAFGGIGLLAFVLPMFLLYDASVRYVNLRRTQETVLRSQCQAAKAELAAEIGRDINTYLCVAQAHLEMLKIKKLRLEPGEYERRLQLAHEQLDHIGQMSAGLLDFMRTESVIEPIDVKELITNTVGFLEPQRRFRDVRLRLDLEAQTSTIPGDPHQIQQVLVNLLLQAAERISHADTGGRTITVGLREHPDGDSIEIHVSDDGPRLPEALRERMFQVGHEGPHGNVGHFIVHSIVRNHRGEIRVEALPATGTRCSVRLPFPGASAWPRLAAAR